ncbi:MAG: hypothetical protein J3R72DRAFT_445693, partial [Linnemannia gamsii]
MLRQQRGVLDCRMCHPPTLLVKVSHHTGRVCHLFFFLFGPLGHIVSPFALLYVLFGGSGSFLCLCSHTSVVDSGQNTTLFTQGKKYKMEKAKENGDTGIEKGRGKLHQNLDHKRYCHPRVFAFIFSLSLHTHTHTHTHTHAHAHKPILGCPLNKQIATIFSSFLQKKI